MEEEPEERRLRSDPRSFRQSQRQSTQNYAEEYETEGAVISVYWIFMIQLISLLTVVLICAYALPELDAEGFNITRPDILLSYIVLVSSLVFMLVSRVIVLSNSISFIICAVYAFTIDYIIAIVISGSPMLAVVTGIVVSLILWILVIAMSFCITITDITHYHIHLFISLIILIAFEAVQIFVDLPLEAEIIGTAVNLIFCFLYTLYAHQMLLSDDFLDMMYENKNTAMYLAGLQFAIYANIVLRAIVLTSIVITEYIDFQLY